MDSVELMPRSRPLTREDLDALRDEHDDGHRYELIDGSLIVTPAPGRQHQTAVLEFAVLLRSCCTPDLQVLIAPFDVALAHDTVVQPDVLVGRRTALTEHDLPVAPVLAVEVLSPSTRRIDLSLKRSRYEAAGCPSYWVVDPLVPSLVAWELHGGAYVEVGRVSGAEVFTTERPFPVSLRPNDFVDEAG